MPDDRLLKHMLTGTLQGTRCRGRQPNTGLMTLLGGQLSEAVKHKIVSDSDGGHLCSAHTVILDHWDMNRGCKIIKKEFY